MNHVLSGRAGQRRRAEVCSNVTRSVRGWVLFFSFSFSFPFSFFLDYVGLSPALSLSLSYGCCDHHGHPRPPRLQFAETANPTVSTTGDSAGTLVLVTVDLGWLQDPQTDELHQVSILLSLSGSLYPDLPISLVKWGGGGGGGLHRLCPLCLSPSFGGFWADTRYRTSFALGTLPPLSPVNVNVDLN